MGIHTGIGSRWRMRTYLTAGCVTCIFSVFVWWWFFALPEPFFGDPYSTVLLDREGNMLGARIADDQQWRFPDVTSVPAHFAEALITFEDKRFRSHPGVDVRALARAMRSNIKVRKVVSGGSTLTMQVVRISRKGEDRNIWQKITEMILAIRVELRYSKKDILCLYASHAPFGGNVVGLEAASWRYYGKPPDLLSWSEAACLAVLPNSPALIHPGRGRDLLKLKRDGLLLKMAMHGILDSTEAQLAMLEPLPDAPLPLPNCAPHLLAYLKTNDTPRLHSTIDRHIQENALLAIQTHHTVLTQNGIQNGAILVLNTKNGEVLAYVGNTDDPQMQHQNAVDMIQAERSSGSILKPLLYASAFTDGLLLPHMLIEDVPTNLRGYQPENFSRSYTGMVPADEALTRSLNVPAVLVLKNYGIERFRQDLIQAGLTTIHFSAEHYGLPLILGGAEVSLWDLCGIYAGMGRTLSHAQDLSYRYDPDDLHGPKARLPQSVVSEPESHLAQAGLWDYGALWNTLEAMRNLARPDEEGRWEQFQSQKPIAWKTGTSFGFRDAWAVGVTPDYTVGVWIGNADGEGRPELMGVRAAAPVMFDVFRNLPGNAWWSPPYDALSGIATCRQSGYIAGPDCRDIDSVQICRKGLESGICPYHVKVYADAAETFQYHKGCADGETGIPQSYFVLPPAAEYYYSRSHPTYRTIPPFHPDCPGEIANAGTAQMQLIYPAKDTRIFVPRELNGEKSHAVFRAAHRSSAAPLYWYMDDQFLGKTQEFHTMELQPIVGMHRLIIVDRQGHRIERKFEVVGT